MTTDRDTIYSDPLAKVDHFQFDQAVARVFPDMIQRSVPGYAETVAMSGIIAARYVQKESVIYDFGCSLGAVTLAMRHALASVADLSKTDKVNIVGIDNSASMIERANHYLALDDHDFPVSLVCDDLLTYDLATTSVSALNYVLQFIEIDQRLSLLKKIAQATLPGGALILSEKLKFDEPENHLQIDLHHDFKRANGYSDLEIAQKRAAIEHVLIPETEETHRQRCLEAGFSKVIRWHQCFNFASFIAIK